MEEKMNRANSPLNVDALSPEEIPDELFETLDDSEKNSEFVAMESKTYFQDAWSRFRKNKLALAALSQEQAGAGQPRVHRADDPGGHCGADRLAVHL